MKYPHLCCSFFRPFFSLMCAFSNVSLLRRVFVFSRRISWESSTFCRCKHLSIRSPFVACLFSFAAFLGKARPFADASTYRNVLPLKEVLRRRSHRSLYVFAFREFAPTYLFNANMKCRCEYWSGSLGAFIRALTPISKDDQSLPKRKNRWSAAKDQKGSYIGKIVNKIPLCANCRFYCSELWMIRFLEDPFIVTPFCCGVSVHAIRSDKKPVIYAFLRGTITIKWRWSLSFMQKTTWFYKITRHISPIYLINSRAL